MAGNLGELRATLVADANSIKQELRAVKQEFSGLGDQGTKTASDVKKMESSFNSIGASSKQIKQLTTVLDNVNAKIEIQQKKLASLKQSYDTTFDSSQRNKLQEQIVNTESSILRLTETSDKTAQKIWHLEDSAKKAGEGFQQLSSKSSEAAVGFGKLSSKLSELGASSKHIEAIKNAINEANPEILQGQLEDVRHELEELGLNTDVIDEIIEKMSELGSAATSAEIEIEAMGAAYLALSIAAGAAIAKAIKTAGDFEQAMQNVRAISQAVGSEFDALRDQALKLGAQTKFTASEAAEAQALLAQAGFKTNDILSSMPGVLALAAAGNTDLALTADIASSALNGFGMAASETARVADVLAKSSIDTNADVTDLGMALKYIAPVAAAMNISLEEAVAAIGELSNAGIKGEMAGTQLRAMLLALASPSKEAAGYMEKLGVSIKDSAGNILPLSNIISQLTSVWGRLTEAQQADVAATLVGREAASGFLTLIAQGEGTLIGYTEALQNAGGTAEQVAGTQMDSLNGSAEQMKAAFESAGIIVGDMFVPAIRKAVEEVTSLMTGFTELSPGVQNSIVAFSTVTPLVLGAVTAFYALKKAIDAVKVAALAANASIPVIGAVALAIGAVSAAAAFLYGKYNEAKEATENFKEAQAALNDTLRDSPINRSVDELEELRSKTEELNTVLNKRSLLQKRINEIQSAWDTGTGTPEMMSEAMEINQQLGEIDEKLRSMGFDGIEIATQKLNEMNKAIKESIGALFDEQKAEVADLAAKNQKVKSMETALATLKSLSSAQKLDQAQKQQLVDVTNALKREYPGLNAVQEEDGRIRVLNIGFIEDQITADRALTTDAARNAQTRIDNLAAEAKAQRESVEAQIKNYGKLLDAMASVSGAKASTFAESVKQGEERMNGKTPSVIDIVTNTARAQNEAELTKLTNEQRAIAEKQREIEKAAASLSSGDFSLGANNKGAPIDLSTPEKAKKEKKEKTTKGKTAAELAAEARKNAYENDLKTIQFQADYYDLTADKQIEKYEVLRKKHAAFLKESVDDARTLQLQLKRLGEDSAKSRYDFSATWIDAESKRMEDSGKTELQIAQMKLDSWTRVRNRYKKDSDEYKTADDKVRSSRKEVATETIAAERDLYDKRAKMIEQEIRRLELNGSSEEDLTKYKIQAWTDLRAKYSTDSEFYEKADEALYQARKTLTDKTLDLTKELVKSEKSRIEEARKKDLAAIEERKKAYVSAQEDKIKAIDDLLAKEAEANEDVDFEEELAKKNARIELLASAVGNDGRQERKKLIEERDKFVLDHERDLRKRELTSQKDALQDEKEAQLQAYEDEKDAAERQYDALIDAFENHSDDIKEIEAGIAAFRVSSAGTANAQILTDLDVFITQYNSKMAAIASTKAAAQKDIDLAEYNANKDLYDVAKSTGNKTEMARLGSRNQSLRDLYGITSDTGKLQSFDVGGVVPGPIGAAVPAIVHGGEGIFNQSQLRGLFRILDTPSLLGAASGMSKSETHIVNHFDMSVNDVKLEDRVDTETVYTEREKSARRLQTMGVKSG
ncbi:MULTISPECIES: phage tail tape measure protein [unclassified Paenibacillus]|uniref:phage tail tape measure protein n=1 Tax=unclassified Paenibacillus TaxID=185978 RepID=UPI0024769784|nr:MULTISPECIES: phage tail tape measure protein [unclassified Paenibacillus]MDH6427276.1 TP901 family phage tail tape measure protein [Paenibacillus sp. PastH-4]MDH6443306.1 TP901 family phage tail tape measure protein [Paenibacillus sp. PastF-4]MDH6525990.1 TP901 family phage tail tape measure protein [Paenibacillus sp. PastH-3]